MARRSSIEDAESPFLLEALEAFRPAGPPGELVRQMAAASRRLSGGARRQLERALVRHLADGGVQDRGSLARAVGALRAAVLERAEAEMEAVEVVEQELSGGDPAATGEGEWEAEAEDESPFEGEDDEAFGMEETIDQEDESPFPAGEASDDEVEGGFQYDTPAEALPATDVDALAAEPPCSPALRRRLERPLLDAAAVARAVASNARRHPKESGIPLAALRERLETYVDRPTLEAALGGQTDESALAAQLAHQFQRKCFREPGFHTGEIGEATLDALGFVRHRGHALNKADRTNSAAAAVLKRVLTGKLTAHLGPDVTARTWFSFMVDAPFLGLTTRYNTGVHLELMRHLREAQKRLCANPKYRDLSPVELGEALLWDAADEATWMRKDPNASLGDRHRGARPGQSTGSMHLAGLAIDIAYRTSPWVGNLVFKEVIGRAATLVGGTVATDDGSRVRAARNLGELADAPGLGRKALHTLAAKGRRTTGEIYDVLARWNQWLKQYFRLPASEAELRRTIAARQTDGTPGVVTAGQSLDDAVGHWKRQIDTDRRKLRSEGGFLTREPVRGFLSLHRDLVIALRDGACLAWGGVDFGYGRKGSGDMMHFDCRVRGVGRAVRGSDIPTTHACQGKRATEGEQGPREETELLPEKTSNLGGQLFRLKSRTGGAATAIFVPDAARGRDPVTLLVWIHGLSRCGGEGKDALDYVRSKQFPLARIVADSGRPCILVAPSMRWSHQKRNAHPLDTPKGMNAFLEEVCANLVHASWASAPAVGKVILAGHSKAYVVLDGLAGGAGDVESSKGPLGRLGDVWSFDSMYGRGSCAAEKWMGWVLARRAVRFRILYLRDSATSWVAERIRAKVKRSSLTNVEFEELDAKTTDHCSMPRVRLRDQLLLAGKEA